MSSNYEKLKKLYSDDPEMLAILDRKQTQELLKELGKDVNMRSALEIARTLKQGDQGDPGYTPVKGKDYFTEEELGKIANFIKDGLKEEVTPKKGVDYFDGEDGRHADESKMISELKKLIPTVEEIVSKIKVPELPVFDEASLLQRFLKQVPVPIALTVEEIVAEIKQKKLLELRDIKGARLDSPRSTIDMNDMRWHGGGLSNITGLITAGTNISITGLGTTASPYVINATASGSVTSVTGTSPIIVDNTDPTQPIITIQLAGALQDGYLSSTDWNTFNNKAAALSGTQNEIAYFNTATTIASLTTVTYPSLTELSYVKGLTSSAQTQINARELLSNKATSFAVLNDTLYPTTQAVATYVTNAVIGLLDYRGSYDASTNLFPATGGSGVLGAILKGDFWICSVGGTLGGTAVTPGDLIIALIDTPGQTAGNWDLISHDLGYTPANTALSNLASVAINTTLVSDTDNTDDLGTSGIFWRTGYFKTSIELGATDTTLTRASAGDVNIEGNIIYRAGGTDVALADGGTGASLADPAANKLWGWDDTDNAIGFWVIGSGLSYDHATHTLSASGTPISFGTVGQIPYTNAGGTDFDYSAQFSFNGARMLLTGAGTGQVGALHINKGDSVNQYIVLQENAGSAGSAYLTFAGSNPGAMAMGALFTAGVPTSYVFTDTGGVPLISIDEATGALNIANLTASELVATDGSKNLQSLAVATYPSLTELSYVKGVTSAIQTQINTKANSAGGLTQFIGNGNWKVFYSDGSGDIQELALGTAGKVLTANGVSSAPTFETPAGGGATTALDNLAAVAINAALIPGTAGALDFGSTTKPWKDIWFAGGSGTPGTNQFKLTGTSTSGLRTVTFQDASGTVAYLTDIPVVTGFATKALDNLASVAINTTLVSDTDVTDDLGTGLKRWKDIHAATLNAGVSAGNTLKLRGYDVDGTAYVDILTITSNNTVTADLNTGVTIGTAYIYRVGGTDVAVADGGTGLSAIAALSTIVANSANTYVAITPGAGQSIRINAGNTAWEAYTPGTGTVTTVSVATANGFAGTVANATTTPAITITTSITGVLKGNGTAISAATAGSDYAVGSIGLAGGQTIAGSTLTAENLTLRANAADLTTGAVIVTSSKEASSSTVGSVQLAGGLAVAKRVYALDMTVTNTIVGGISGNAGTATTLQNTRTIWGQNFNGSANVTGTLALGTADLTLTGSIGATGARATKVWATDIESTNMPTVGGTSLTTVSQTFQNKTITNSNNVLGGVTMTLGSDADGDIYYRSSNVLTRLAKGTALQGLRMNAGATAPEWAAISASNASTTVAGVVEIATQAEYDLRTATGGTGALLVANLANIPLTSFNQMISISATNSAIMYGCTSSPDGSVVVMNINQNTLVRMARDARTGAYYVTHERGSLTVGDSTSSSGMVIVGSYVYVFYDGGTNVACNRYDLADLANTQAMSFGTAIAAGGSASVQAWYDAPNSNFYVTPSNTTSRKLTVSGSAFTEVSTATTSASIAAGNVSMFNDGTTTYAAKWVSAAADNLILYKLTTASGSSVSTLITTIPEKNQNKAPFIANIDSLSLYIGMCSNFAYDGTNATPWAVFYPVTKT